MDAGFIDSFSYEEAFSRTLGWVTAAELQRLRQKRVAIVGLGGVGGSHATTLARLGIGKFRLAEFDHFELANFNRQYGATMSNLFEPKSKVIADVVRDINPEADVDLWSRRIAIEEAGDFIGDSDIYLDSIDFFELEVRRALFRAARNAGIPALTAAPIGTGTAWLVFDPNGMSFDEYFGFRQGEEEENYIRFLVGLAPKALHRGGLVDPSRVDIANRKTPSTPMGITLSAGVAVTEVAKILLGRGGLEPAPWYHQFDASAGRSVKGRSWLQGKNPVRELKVRFAKKQFTAMKTQNKDDRYLATTCSEKVIELARWSPSIGNEQPWRFEKVTDRSFRVAIGPFDETNPYEFAKGRPIWLAGGALLESISLGASRLNMRADIKRADSHPRGSEIRYDVILEDEDLDTIDPLSRFLEHRSVDRTAYKSRPLSAKERCSLSECLPKGWKLQFKEELGDRWRMGWLNSDATVLRMLLRQTYPVHKRVFRTDCDQPETGLPISSVPLDFVSRRIFKWILGSPFRTRLFVKGLAGARSSSVQTDVLTGLRSSAHFLISAPQPLSEDPFDAIQAGRVMQRFWLTAESLGLVLQPSFAPLIFADHAQKRTLKTKNGELRRATSLANRLKNYWELKDLNDVVFLGRIGQPRHAHRPIRSHRKSVSKLVDSVATLGSDPTDFRSVPLQRERNLK